MRLSLKPDPWTAWIYDPSHRDYHSEEAQWLREKRAWAMRNVPRYMLDDARFNDAERDRLANA